MNRSKIVALISSALLLIGGGTALGAAERSGDMGSRMNHCIGGGIDMLAVAADYLEMTEDEIQARRYAGESLAEIAIAEGKTVEGLVAALVDAHAVLLQALVDDGTITEEQRDVRLVRIEARMWKVVERHVGSGGGGHHHDGGGHHGGGPGGPQ